LQRPGARPPRERSPVPPQPKPKYRLRGKTPVAKAFHGVGGSKALGRKELIHVPKHVLQYFDVGNDPYYINAMKPPVAVPKT
jgi:hypothetical protein